MLENCNAVVCEADIDDFQDINAMLVEAGLLAHLKPQAFWEPGDNAAVIGVQESRRKMILEQNRKILNRLAFGPSKAGRNDPCPCGSGQKFKHCCGSY